MRPPSSQTKGRLGHGLCLCTMGCSHSEYRPAAAECFANTYRGLFLRVACFEEDLEALLAIH